MLRIRNRRGQLLSGDLLFGIIIFFLSFAYTLDMWSTAYTDLRVVEEEYEINWLSETVSDQLVRTPGIPYNWNTESVVTYGLVEVDQNSRDLKTRILDADKVMYLLDSFSKNYTKVRNKLLGSSKYDMFIEVSCLDKSSLTCLQGLKLDNVTDNVYCNNYVVNVYGGKTQTYKFIEAEDIWFNEVDTYCHVKGCSGNNMSFVDGSAQARIDIDPGLYNIWVRTVEENSPTKIVFDGVEYDLFHTKNPGLITWQRLGKQEFTTSVNVWFADTNAGNIVDAILLTTDLFYNPQTEYPNNFGNPNNESVCIIGLETEGQIISSKRKNGIISVPIGSSGAFEGMQLKNDKVVEFNVVLWSGQAIQPSVYSAATTTSTTLAVTGLECIDIPQSMENCISQNPKYIDIKNVTLWNPPLECGTEENITVRWRGRHAGDDNYFGFFIDDETRYLGSCKSPVQVEDSSVYYDYEMNCSFTPDAASIRAFDGQHSIIVTGEDFGGYCLPGNVNADDEYWGTLSTLSCGDYIPLTASVQGFGGKLTGCKSETDTVEGVHSMTLVNAGSLSCNVYEQIRLRFEGEHGDDELLTYALVVKDGGDYKCVTKCRSGPPAPESGPLFYEMSCTFMMNNTDCAGNNYSISDGNYPVYFIVESHEGEYCVNPEDPQAEAVGYIDVDIDSCEKEIAKETKTFNYNIGDYGGAVAGKGAELFTDIYVWGPTAVDDGLVGDAENTGHSEQVSNVVIGTCKYWNIWLNGTGNFLYQNNKAC